MRCSYATETYEHHGCDSTPHASSEEKHSEQHPLIDEITEQLHATRERKTRLLERSCSGTVHVHLVLTFMDFHPISLEIADKAHATTPAYIGSPLFVVTATARETPAAIEANENRSNALWENLGTSARYPLRLTSVAQEIHPKWRLVEKYQ